MILLKKSWLLDLCSVCVGVWLHECIGYLGTFAEAILVDKDAAISYSFIIFILLLFCLLTRLYIFRIHPLSVIVSQPLYVRFASFLHCHTITASIFGRQFQAYSGLSGIVMLSPQRVPHWHQEIHQHPSKYVARHALTPWSTTHPKDEWHHIAELAALLSLNGDPPRQSELQHQPTKLHSRQRLTSCHATL